VIEIISLKLGSLLWRFFLIKKKCPLMVCPIPPGEFLRLKLKYAGDRNRACFYCINDFIKVIKESRGK